MLIMLMLSISMVAVRWRKMVTCSAEVPPWNHHGTTMKPLGNRGTTMKPPPNHQGTSIPMFWFRNSPIWEILWNTGNAVSSETVQSGKFYGIREMLSVQKRSNLGKFMEYGKRCQFRNGPIWETYGTRVFVVWYIQWWPNPRFSWHGMFLARFSEGGQ